MKSEKHTGVSPGTAVLLSAVLIVVIWEAGARVLHAPLILPAPSAVFQRFFELSRSSFFWKNVGFTAIRCFAAFGISLLAGTLLGIGCGMSASFNNFVAFPLAVLRSTPVVSFILLALFWFDSSVVPVFVAVLMTLPVMITAVASGFSAVDEKLLAMAKIYGLSFRQQFLYIKIPAVVPFFLSGAVSSFGLSWKVVAAGEVLSLPRYGAGTLLQKAQVHLETQEVVAVTFVIVLLSFVFEKLLSGLVSRFQHRRLRTDAEDPDYGQP
ncbi:MAG: ABC transporter permease subunit [Treponema sp.]|jgi:NitT/TauT family transport system permease protein|nr:ABC transporter permease subunit [Treponema sp.]